ncbi:MAG: O-antigen ligase family protein [Nostoc sp.]|uniref:O-antigen ligase family protein n=1 Tax=Nostoc sp. TaxID=1180 RepID=UPI002FFC124E
MKIKKQSFENITWFLLLVIGLSFNWSILRNYSIPLLGSNLNAADFLLMLVIFRSIAKCNWGLGPSYLSGLLVLSTIGIFVIGAIVCLSNINGNISILIRFSRGFLAILAVSAYSRNFSKQIFETSLLGIILISTVALIFYSLNQLGVLPYGSFDFVAGATNDDFTNISISESLFKRFFFIEFIPVYFSLAICFFLFTVARKKSFLKVLAFTGIFSCYVVMMLNLSRSFLITLIILSISMIFNVSIYNRTKSFQIFFTFIIAVISGMLVFWILQGSEGFMVLASWFQSLIDPSNPNGGYASVEVRQSHFTSAFEAFADSPLFGHGIGMDFTEYHLKSGTLENPYNFGNTFSLRIAQTGLIGLFLWIGFNLIIIKHIYFVKYKTSEELLLRNTFFIVHMSSFISCLTSGDSTSNLSYGLVYACIILMTDYINKYPIPQL